MKNFSKSGKGSSFLAAILVLAFSMSVHGQGSFGPVVIASGGGVMKGTGTTMTVTVGEPIVRPTAGHRAGFWYAVLAEAETIETAVEDIDPVIPTRYELDQNYPNPFNPTTSIRYMLPELSEVELVITNALGHRVATLVSGEQATGVYTVTWDARDDNNRPVASGFYLYILTTPRFVESRGMLLVK